jgi:colicin import membrane protein
MATEIIEVASLVPTEHVQREKLFLNENNEVQPLIEAVASHYKNLIFSGMDGSTDAGRKAIKKVAAELNSKIKEIDDIGKSVTDILKAKPKKIDAGRKLIRDALTEVYNEIRKPVVEYEAEQARIKAEEQARIEAQRQAEQAELARLRAEKEQREREAKIAEEAANKAKLEAENKVREAELALQREREENRRKEAMQLAEEQRKANEEAKRLADVEHKRKVKFSAYKCLLENGINKDLAVKVINLIDAGEIQNVFIKY